MIGVLALVGLALVAAPAVVARWGRRLHPADWTRWIAVSLIAGVFAIEAAMLLVAAPTVLRAMGVHGLADACARMGGATPPGGIAVGWVAAAVSVGIPGLMVGSWSRGARTQRCIGTGLLLAPTVDRHDGRLVVVPDDEPLAFSVPSRDGGYVVVSSTLVNSLSELELAAVARHERAHLRCRHSRYLLLAAAVEVGLAVHPLIRASIAQLRCALERWADEEAAGGTSSARATTRSALLTAALGPLPAVVTGFGPVSTVAARVTALERPAPRSTALMRFLAGAPLTATVFVAVGAAGAASGELWAVLTMPIRCALRQA